MFGILNGTNKLCSKLHDRLPKAGTACADARNSLTVDSLLFPPWLASFLVLQLFPPPTEFLIFIPSPVFSFCLFARL